jgi:hypothetical protein
MSFKKFFCFIFLVFICSHLKCEQVGLVCHWNFNEGKGNKVNDISGNKNDGYIYNGEWVNIGDGYAVRFNGNTYIDFGNNEKLDINPPFTITFWVNPSRIEGGTVWCGGATGASTKNCISLQNGKIFFDQYPPSMGALTSNTGIPLNEWTFISVIQTEKTRSIYINGKKDIEDDRVEKYEGKEVESWNMGRRPFYTYPNYFYGIVDEFKIYKGELDEKEIEREYKEKSIIYIPEKGLLKSIKDLPNDEKLILSYKVYTPIGAWKSLVERGNFKLWMDKYVYETLDSSAGIYLSIPEKLTKEGNKGVLLIEKDRDIVKKSEFEIKTAIGIDINLKDLKPGNYKLMGIITDGDEVLAKDEWNFSIVKKNIPIPKDVEIKISNPTGNGYIFQPVHLGLPFPKGLIKSINEIKILDEDNKEIPFQSKIYSRWDRYGSIRWAGIDFIAEHKGKKEKVFYLKFQKNYTQKIDFMLSREEEGFIKIDNGKLLLLIPKGKGKLIEAIYLDKNKNGKFEKDESIVSGISDYLLEWYREDVFTTENDIDKQVKIEENGNIKSVIRIEGWYKNSQGEKICKSIVRIYIYHSLSQIDISHTWIMTEESGKAAFSDIGLNIDFGENMKEANFGVDGKKCSTDFEDNIYLLQDDFNHCEIYKDKNKIYEGEKGNGWILGKTDNTIIGLSSKDFWQNFPKEVEFQKNRLIFHFWPLHNKYREILPARENFLHMPWLHYSKILSFIVPPEYLNFLDNNTTSKYWIYLSGGANAVGLSKTHQLTLFLSPDDEKNIEERVSITANYPEVKIDPEWMVNSGVFGDLSAKNDNKFPETERVIERIYKSEVELCKKTNDYGMFIFGGRHTSWNFGEKRWDIYRGLRNTHHNAPRIPYLLYVRSGDPYYLIEGIRETRWICDFGFCNYTDEKYENFVPWYPYRKIEGALCDYKGYVPWYSGARVGDYNSMVDFLHWYTYLTGDERGKEIAGKWWLTTEKYVGFSMRDRSGAGTLASTIFLYNETQDNKMIPFIHENFSSMCKGQTDYGYFLEWENYAPWIERYYDLTKSEKAKEVMKRWAEAFMNGWGDLSSSWGHYLNIISKAAMITEEEKFIKYCNGLLFEETYASPENYLFPEDFLRTSLGHYLLYGLIYGLKVKEKFGIDEYILPRTTWYPAQLKEGKYITEVYILDEKDDKFKILLAGQLPGKGYIKDPGGNVVKEFDYTSVPAHRPHDNSSMAKWGEIEIEKDGKKGIYKLYVENKSYYRFVIPVTDDMPEIYPVPENRMVPFRAALYFPKDTGVYKVYFDNDVDIPVSLFLEEKKPVEVKYKKGIPFLIDTSKNNKFMILGSKYVPGKPYYKISVEGGNGIPGYFAVDIGRLFWMENK